MSPHHDRRIAERYPKPPMYTPIRLRRLSEDAFGPEGHIHDISAGGVRFEMDTAIEPGERVAIMIDLGPLTPPGVGRAVFAFGNVVWCDISEPGPAMMAIAFTEFSRQGDHARLHAAMCTSTPARRAA